jgi:hypothetical protein
MKAASLSHHFLQEGKLIVHLLRRVFTNYRSSEVLVQYKHLLFLNPRDSQFISASENARPLPLDRILEKPAPNPIPKMGAPFHDDASYEWCEFKVMKFGNGQELPLHPNTPSTYWYYLGGTSTEAKAQYTHDPKVQIHNRHSNYLDTMEVKQAVQVQRLPPVAIPAAPRSLPASYPNVQPKQAPPNGSQREDKKKGVEKQYEYKPKSMPGVTIDPQALRQQRIFQTNVNGMAQVPGQYGQPNYSQLVPPGAYPSGATPQQVSYGAIDPRLHQQVATPYIGFQDAGTNAHGGQNSAYLTKNTVGGQSSIQASGISSMRDPVGHYQAQESGHNGVQQHRKILPAIAPGPAPSPKPVHRKPAQAKPKIGAQKTAAKAPTLPKGVRLVDWSTRRDDSISLRLKKYTYLYKVYMATPLVYESPYKPGGGFTEKALKWLPSPPAGNSTAAHMTTAPGTTTLQTSAPKTAAAKASGPKPNAPNTTAPTTPSLAEGYLLKRTPSQQELIRNTVSSPQSESAYSPLAPVETVNNSHQSIRPSYTWSPPSQTGRQHMKIMLADPNLGQLSVQTAAQPHKSENPTPKLPLLSDFNDAGDLGGRMEDDFTATSEVNEPFEQANLGQFPNQNNMQGTDVDTPDQMLNREFAIAYNGMPFDEVLPFVPGLEHLDGIPFGSRADSFGPDPASLGADSGSYDPLLF